MSLQSSHFLQAGLTEVTNNLNQALADVELYNRLKNAPAEVTRLGKDAAELTAALSDALAREQQEKITAFAANIRNLRVSARQAGENLLRTTFVVTYEKLAWNSSNHQNEWTPVEQDISALDHSVYAYMVQHRPSVIPDAILNLAPGDPVAAMDKYFTACSRGVVRT